MGLLCSLAGRTHAGTSVNWGRMELGRALACCWDQSNITLGARSGLLWRSVALVSGVLCLTGFTDHFLDLCIIKFE